MKLIAAGFFAAAALAAGLAVVPSTNDAAPRVAAPAPGVLHVYKTESCACCAKWVEHMKAAGFTVEVENVTDLSTRKQALRVPQSLWSCHTAVIDGRVVEGHVPAADVKRMLEADGPEGLAVAGMPTGVPGMQEDGTPFTVHAFSEEGEVSVFAEH